MATITEDYVSFQTAELLKEKGMDKSCFKHYVQKNNNDGTSEAVTVCTLQIATKWLREVHNLSVEVYRTACGYIGCIVAIPSGTDIKFLEEGGDDLNSGTYTKWEYACEASLKYCLEILI